MAVTHIHSQVVIVGAGPVGLALAAELCLGGVDVVVLEQRDTPTTQSRASTLHARTMELFDSRDLLADFGTPPNEPKGHFGGVPLDLTLPSPYPGQWKVPQTVTETILGQRACTMDARILRGHSVRDVAAGDDHCEVTATSPESTVRVHARYAVGCDGADSTVRSLVGADFPGADAERELLRADVAGIEIPDRRFQRLERGLAIAARRADGVTRVMVHEFGTRPGPGTGVPELGQVVDAWKRVTGEDISGGTPLWVNSFGDAARQLSCYRHGRVLFAGDAAHQQMPIGGQALNLGLQDAFNLGWKLALVVRGEAPGSLLDTYHYERHAVGRRVLTNIKAQATLLLGGPEVEAVREVFGELVGIESARRHLAGMISGLEVRYDVGPADHRLLGARLPHVELTTDKGRTSTTRLLRSGRGVLLDVTGEPRRPAWLREAARPWAGRVDVTAAQPLTAAQSVTGAQTGAGGDGIGVLADTGALLVRPDGYVAWADGAAEQRGDAGLREALGRWFGAPAQW